MSPAQAAMSGKLENIADSQRILGSLQSFPSMNSRKARLGLEVLWDHPGADAPKLDIFVSVGIYG